MVFEPDGRRANAQNRETLLKVAQRVGIAVRSECGGKGTCGKCRLQISPESAVTPPSQAEIKHLTAQEIQMGYRLACQTVITGETDIQVMVPPESRGTQRRLQVEGITIPITLRPAVHSVFIAVPPVDPARPIPDDERLIEQLHQYYGGKRGYWIIPLHVRRKIPGSLRAAFGHVTVTLWNKRILLDVAAGDSRNNQFGVALDIGTSKLVASLHSLVTGKLLAVAGLENPQIRYGEDIMSRLSFAATDPANRLVLQNLVVDSINLLLARLAKEATIALDNVYELVVVGNTVMTSLFLGLDTKHLGYGPFTAPARGPFDVSSQALTLSLPPQANVHVLPCVAGYVGADAVADILATRIHRSRKISLLIDIGTNSEVVLGNRDRLTACSCAAGPAFEGAQIEHGMKAVSGAIEQVTIHPNTLEVEVNTIDAKPAIGICGSGVVDAVAQLAEVGLLAPQGRFIEHPTTKLLHDQRGKRFVLVEGGNTEVSQSPITLS
ncbi:MAG: ASKHA domain-containing protein, partial [Promethearchaeota archaeon]